MAKKMTVKEIVTKINFGRIKKLLRNGSNFPGVNKLVKYDNLDNIIWVKNRGE